MEDEYGNEEDEFEEDDIYYEEQEEEEEDEISLCSEQLNAAIKGQGAGANSVA